MAIESGVKGRDAMRMRLIVRGISLTVAVNVGVAAVQLPSAFAVDPDQGPLNVAGTGWPTQQVNDSALIATPAGVVDPGETITATAAVPSGTVELATYSIPITASDNPVTGADNATIWVPIPDSAVSVTVRADGQDVTQVPVLADAAGSSITVVQATDGSRSITATAVFPRFSGQVSSGGTTTTVEISRNYFEQQFFGYAFHVFDADTQEWIDPQRTAVQKRWIDDSTLELVDPLVLPESALGRNIRVGFVTWYYVENFNFNDRTSPTPVQYGGLSAAILMRLGASAGSARPLAAMQQFSVPAGTDVTQCGALAPEHVDAPALRQMRNEGWSLGYAEWPNNRQGGWVCSRQPVLTSLGWVVL